MLQLLWRTLCFFYFQPLTSYNEGNSVFYWFVEIKLCKCQRIFSNEFLSSIFLHKYFGEKSLQISD